FGEKVFEGGQEHLIDTPLDEMPVFAKGGSVIPEYPVMQYTFEKNIDALKLNIYYGEGTHDSYVYIDHGETFAYEQSVYNEKHFIVECQNNVLSVRQHIEGLYNERFDTYKLYFFGLPAESKSVHVDGDTVAWSYDEEGTPYISVEKEFRKLIID